MEMSYPKPNKRLPRLAVKEKQIFELNGKPFYWHYTGDGDGIIIHGLPYEPKFKVVKTKK